VDSAPVAEATDSAADDGTIDAPRARHHRAGLPVIVPVAAMVVVVDQLCKLWATEALSSGRTIDVVWTLRFNLVHNEGSAFSLGRGLTPLIAIVAIAVAVAIVAVGHRVSRVPTAVALGAVLGGALGNVVDRVARADGFLDGAVVDFLDLQWWPVFNVADIAIVVGGFALALLLGADERRSSDAKA
jgi:signal peptidase II